MAKGQKRSSREARKPKQTPAKATPKARSTVQIDSARNAGAYNAWPSRKGGST